jgi:hypothetical protein
MTPRAALSLAQWLQFEHPEIFTALLAQAAPRLGSFGDDATVALDVGTIDTSTFSSPTSIQISAPDTSAIANTDTSSFWGSIASGVSSAVSSVGSFIASPQGLSSLTQLGTAYYRAQAPVQATLQTQIARAQAGHSAAPISYMQNASGQIVPVYAGQMPPAAIAAGGQYVLTPNGIPGYTLNARTLQTLAPSWLSQVQSYLPYIALGGLGLFLLSRLAHKQG